MQQRRPPDVYPRRQVCVLGQLPSDGEGVPDCHGPAPLGYYEQVFLKDDKEEIRHS